MTEILRPRVSTLEFITKPSLTAEFVGLDGARAIILGWIAIANDRGDKSARRHVERLMKALHTDIVGVIAFHIRRPMHHVACQDLAAVCDPEDFEKTLPDGTPLFIHEYARAAALVELYRAGVIMLPDRLQPFVTRFPPVKVSESWQGPCLEWEEHIACAQT